MKKKLLLIGGGGHCRACIDVIEQEGNFEIAGIVEKASTKNEDKVFGYPVIGSDEDLEKLRNDYLYALVTVGQIKTPDIRMKIYDSLLKFGFEMPVITSPFAFVSPHAEIASGTIIMHHALVNAGAVVGKNCIINSKALVEHDAIIGDHCHISTGAIVNGQTKVREGTFVGSNVVTRENIVIGARCVVGCGARVLNSLNDNEKFIF